MSVSLAYRLLVTMLSWLALLARSSSPRTRRCAPDSAAHVKPGHAASAARPRYVCGHRIITVYSAKVTHAGTEEKRSEQPRIPASEPFPPVVAGVGFERADVL
jgi:hypothetical protein